MGLSEMERLGVTAEPGSENGSRQYIDPRSLPRDPATGQPLPPKLQPGYYPGFSTLSQQSYWDAATRDVVLKRVNEIPDIQFFTDEELPLIEAIVNRLLPQDDRDPAHRIPIVPFIDEKLRTHKIDGYRYEDLPEEDEMYRLAMKGIQAIAQHLHGKSFVDLGHREQDDVLKTLHDCKPPAGQEYWDQMGGDVRHVWVLLLTDVVSVYYAHPSAWDEIGFGGPAYPRGYMRLQHGYPEPWEVEEVRYEWDAPPDSLSDVYEPIGLVSNEEAQFHGQIGQSGTH